MRSNRKHTVTELANYIHLYEAGYFYRELCEKYGLLLDDSSFNQYYLKFLEHGMAGLESTRKNNTYTQAFKQSAILDYGTGQIVAYKLSKRNNQLVKDTVVQSEEDLIPKETLLHSDREVTSS